MKERSSSYSEAKVKEREREREDNGNKSPQSEIELLVRNVTTGVREKNEYLSEREAKFFIVKHPEFVSNISEHPNRENDSKNQKLQPGIVQSLPWPQ